MSSIPAKSSVRMARSASGTPATRASGFGTGPPRRLPWPAARMTARRITRGQISKQRAKSCYMRARMKEAIEAFWRWWPEAHARVEAAIEGRAWTDALVEEITARVQALDESLIWSVCPGREAQHAFCLSAAANP